MKLIKGIYHKTYLLLNSVGLAGFVLFMLILYTIGLDLAKLSMCFGDVNRSFGVKK